jgi:signal transduction histidine kinase
MAEPRRRLLPRRTVRLRLTLLYGGLFLLSGAALLGTVYLLVAARFPGRYGTGHGSAGAATGQVSSATGAAAGTADLLRELLVQSGIALAVMAVAAFGLGWLTAGRILRPLRAMASATREISEHNLHRRLAVAGPPDEITDLAGTIDGLLARLATAFDARRGFVAHASHELRTPLTVQRTLVEVALANPAADVAALRATCARVLVANREQEELIEALLTLARGEQGLHHREPVDLAVLAAGVVDGRLAEADRRGLRLRTDLGPARTTGDGRLLAQLVANLVDNALRHNEPAGWLDVTTRDGWLAVTNTGPPVPAGELPRLRQPFERLAPERGTPEPGHGLGLAIVSAIAEAHGATLTLEPRPEGGLRARVSFPGAPVRRRRAAGPPAG